MNIYNTMTGVLSTIFLSGALASPAATQGAPQRSEEKLGSDPKAVCYMTQTPGTETQEDDPDTVKARETSCLNHVAATQLIKQGRISEAMDILARTRAPSFPTVQP